jgi:hypothetical protein
MKRTFTPAEMEQRLRAAQIGKVTVEASAISGSPYDYVYVYFTEREAEDWHLIVSDNYEMGDGPGIVVGLHQHYEEACRHVEVIPPGGPEVFQVIASLMIQLLIEEVFS